VRATERSQNRFRPDYRSRSQAHAGRLTGRGRPCGQRTAPTHGGTPVRVRERPNQLRIWSNRRSGGGTGAVGSGPVLVRAPVVELGVRVRRRPGRWPHGELTPTQPRLAVALPGALRVGARLHAPWKFGQPVKPHDGLRAGCFSASPRTPTGSTPTPRTKPSRPLRSWAWMGSRCGDRHGRGGGGWRCPGVSRHG